jgi:hypothetical protein
MLDITLSDIQMQRCEGICFGIETFDFISMWWNAFLFKLTSVVKLAVL